MSDTQTRIDQINAKQLATNIGLSGIDGLNNADRTEFDAARNQIIAAIDGIRSRLHWSIQIQVRNNDLYWNQAGGLNLFVVNGSEQTMGYFWQDKNGTVFAGGNYHTGDAGTAVGTGQSLNLEAVEAYVLDLVESSL